MSTARKRLMLILISAIVVTATGWSASFPAPIDGASAVAPGCLAQDSFAIDLKDELVGLMGRTDALSDTTLAAEGVTRVVTSQIAIVADTTICRRAANAYSTAIEVPDENRLVHSVRVGIRYVVIDPSHHSGSYRVGVTFDSSFTQIHTKFAY
jgi:hypothetical protein